MWGSRIAMVVGACLGSGALVYVTRQWPAADPAARSRPAPATLERPCGAGMALAGLLGEPGVL